LGWLSLQYFGGGYLFGVGYDGIASALSLKASDGLRWGLGSGLTLTVLFLLIFLKIIATSLTLSAGGSGGVFAPALFVGAMLGGVFGLLANSLFPGSVAPPGAYVLVGMGAVFAGAAHAPITGILILFEMTDDYHIILPLMIAVVISHLVASGFNPDSIFTIKLRRRGALAPPKSPQSALDLILAADAMSVDVPTTTPEEKVRDLAARMFASGVHGFPVLDDLGKLIGIVTKHDVESVLMNGPETAKVVHVMTRNLVTCTPDSRLREVLPRLTSLEVGQIPVVSKEDPTRLVGVLRRKQIFWAYGELANEHRRLLAEAGLGPNTNHEDSVQVELTVGLHDATLCYKRIRDIKVPEQSLIVLMRRGNQAIVPRGDTQVEPGDVLVLLTTHTGEERLRKWVSSVTQ
jgi:CIC family chloride channel protein